MKKSIQTALAKTFMFGLSLLILVSCEDSTSKNGETGEEQISKTETLESCKHSSCTCCDTLNFCGISLVEFESYLLEYRDKVWKRTSDFGTGEGNGYNPSTIMTDLASGGSLSNSTGLDARYMDVPIDELEQYLCAIRNSSEVNKSNTIRLYYIRYDNTYQQQVNRSLNQNAYQGKHAVAFVPVQLDYTNGSTIFEGIDSLYGNSFVWIPGAKNCGSHTMRANHNGLNPPPYDNMGPFLKRLDANNRLQ